MMSKSSDFWDTCYGWYMDLTVSDFVEDPAPGETPKPLPSEDWVYEQLDIAKGKHDRSGYFPYHRLNFSHNHGESSDLFLIGIACDCLPDDVDRQTTQAFLDEWHNKIVDFGFAIAPQKRTPARRRYCTYGGLIIEAVLHREAKAVNVTATIF